MSVQPFLSFFLGTTASADFLPFVFPTVLPLANSSYCQTCSGLPPPSDSVCRAHSKKRRIPRRILRFLTYKALNRQSRDRAIDRRRRERNRQSPAI